MEKEEGETPRQTGNRTEERLKGLGHVVGKEVLVDLHHCNDGLLGVCKRCLTTDTENFLVVNHTTRQPARVNNG